jgi:hypothetical protein
VSTDPDVLLLIGRMDGKLDLLLTRHDKLDERITALESFKGYALGAAAVISAAVSALLSFAPTLIERFLK